MKREARQILISQINRLMQDGRARTSYQIADALYAPKAAPPEWWRVAWEIEGKVFQTFRDRNGIRPNSPFAARHNGECWEYRLKGKGG